MKTAFLLIISNLFMTLAWYGHLKFLNKPLGLVILGSWGIAFFEYMFQVPANRIGEECGFTLVQLKMMQECITLAVFSIVTYMLFGSTLKWNNLISFVLIIGAAYFTFKG